MRNLARFVLAMGVLLAISLTLQVAPTSQTEPDEFREVANSIAATAPKREYTVNVTIDNTDGKDGFRDYWLNAFREDWHDAYRAIAACKFDPSKAPDARIRVSNFRETVNVMVENGYDANHTPQLVLKRVESQLREALQNPPTQVYSGVAFDRLLADDMAIWHVEYDTLSAGFGSP